MDTVLCSLLLSSIIPICVSDEAVVVPWWLLDDVPSGHPSVVYKGTGDRYKATDEDTHRETLYNKNHNG